MKARIALLFTICLCPLTALASFNWNWNLNPYVGIDGAKRIWDWDKDFGEGVFAREYWNVSPFIGLQLNEYLSVEAGYEESNRVEQKTYFYGDVVADNPIQPVLGFFSPEDAQRSSKLYFAEAAINGPHFNIVGQYPLLNTNADVYFSLGVGFMQFKVNVTPISPNMIENNPMVFRWDSDRRPVLRIGIGLKRMLTPRIGARIFSVWEQTQSLEGTTPGLDFFARYNDNQPVSFTDNYTARSKGNMLFGLGLFYTLWPK